MVPGFCRTSTFIFAFTGAVLLWAALPPLDFWLLAWIAPVPWIILIRRRELDRPRPYLALAVVGFIFWMAALHWLRLPYWATAFGWLALSFYFAFYIPVFIGLSRIAVHRMRLPVILAAPVVWTGLELARAHLLTGMTMASLGHTQYHWIQLIQISDLAGAFAVSFCVMFVAACIGRIPSCEGKPKTYWPVLPAVVLMVSVLAYGYERTTKNETTPGARIALIQGCIDSVFGGDDPHEKFYWHYFDLSQQAVDQFGSVDLIVWPETYFRNSLILYDADAGLNSPKVDEAGITIEQFHKNLKTGEEEINQAFVDTATQLKSPMLVGLDAQYYTVDDVYIYNSAVYVSAEGKILGRYDKKHLVMFGEYIPFADHLAWLYQLSPLSMGITPGKEPVAFQVGNIRISPSICFESVLSHVIRDQINTLKANGQEPDVLVNVTNDGWFWGSSELDMHLVCGVFRAVECRKPFLVSANTGFSAWIDADGRIIKQGRRHETDAILADVRVDHRQSWYLYYGDWPAGLCLLGCMVLAGIGCWDKIQLRRMKCGQGE